ncbi:hypothetical protein [Streptomyces sp. LN325]|uniref:hypothetical protein n=1 Tax=Streptomyces sp. LN325 TaxID=3112976 RepID=UPI00371E4EC3
MADFLVGVLSSIAATWLGLIAAFLWSGRFRWMLVVMLSRLSSGDFGQSWTDKKAAEADISRELRRARNVALLTGRGNELQRATFDQFLHRRTTAGSSSHMRVLLPCTGSGPTARWTLDREAELASFDRSFGSGQLTRQIETNISHLETHQRDGLVEIRRYDFPHLGRVLLTDRVAYFTPYSSDSHGRDSKVLKYPAASPMYGTFVRLFEKVWESSSAQLS